MATVHLQGDFGAASLLGILQHFKRTTFSDWKLVRCYPESIYSERLKI